MVEIEDVHKHFGAVRALDGVSLSVAAGEVVCLIGPSGSGKSTLLRCINFLEEPTAGVVRVNGTRVGWEDRAGRARRASARELARTRAEIGMVFQHFYLWPHMIALENVIEGLVTVKGMAVRGAAARGRALLEKVGLTDKMEAYPEHLSGGQRQRVAIARALAMDPRVRVMEQVAGEGMTMLVATHEMGFARKVADRVVFLDQGRILEVGTPDELFGRPRHERTRRFLEKILV
jgi:polar amino acid transport system ATP-binding protein